VAGNPRIEFVLEAIQAAVTIVAPLPASEESRRISRDASALRSSVEGWRQQPPTRAMRDEIMQRVLRLHVAAATLARLSPTGPAASSAMAGRVPPASADDEHERPTVPPPFDIEAFAREATAPDSDRRTSSGPPTPRRGGRPEVPGSAPGGAGSTIDRELDQALAPLDDVWGASDEPVTTRQPSVSIVPPAKAPQRRLSPSSIERAVLGAVEGPTVSQREIDDPSAEMLDCYDLGDYAGAIALSDLILAEAPDNPVAQDCREKSVAALEAIYAARLGASSRIPIVVMARSKIDGLEIDHRAGFLLSLVDGSSTIEAILDVCGMPKLDALRILHELVQRGAIGFE
jgi:hypothetical protein